MCKKTIFFLLVFSIWMFSSVFFPFDVGFYLSLSIPNFIFNSSIIGIIWIIIFLLNSLCFFMIIKNKELNNDYYFIIILNYICCETFPLFFSYFHSLILCLASTIGTFITSYFLLIETRKISKKSSLLLLPYFIMSFISSIWIIAILILN